MLFLRHTSASLIIQENADPDVQTDLVTALAGWRPPTAGWVHTGEGPDDMPAHVKAMLTGVSLHVPVSAARWRSAPGRASIWSSTVPARIGARWCCNSWAPGMRLARALIAAAPTAVLAHSALPRQRRVQCARQIDADYRRRQRLCTPGGAVRNGGWALSDPHYRLVIADDHPLFRGALREAVAGLFEHVDIAEAGSFDEVAKLLDHGGEVDLVLLDLTMPGVRGFSGLMYLRAQYPSVPVVVVSANDDPAVIRRCMDFGASGFIPKTLGIEAMRDSRSRACSKAASGPRPTSISRAPPTPRPPR